MPYGMVDTIPETSRNLTGKAQGAQQCGQTQSEPAGTVNREKFSCGASIQVIEESHF